MRHVSDSLGLKRLVSFWGRIWRRIRMPTTFATLLQQATAHGSKSTVLRPLSWFLGICVSALIGCVQVKGPNWAMVMFGIMSGTSGLLFLCAFVYCLFTDKDALRSERYSIQKLAIEKGFGDSFIGMLPPVGNRSEDSTLQTAEGKVSEK